MRLRPLSDRRLTAIVEALDKAGTPPDNVWRNLIAEVRRHRERERADRAIVASVRRKAAECRAREGIE